MKIPINFAVVADLFYPRLCVVCGRVLTENENYMCTHCLFDFPLSEETLNGGVALFEDMPPIYRPINFYTLFYYNRESAYKLLMTSLKYGNRKELGRFLGTQLAHKISEQPDVLLPVPLHPKKLKRRGYNQSAEIAKGISDVLKLPVYDNILVRLKNNETQTFKNAVERAENVSGIFAVADKSSVECKHVLIVDDVITTGATISACIEALKTIPGIKISVACLARTFS
jgi:ComF family protein